MLGCIAPTQLSRPCMPSASPYMQHVHRICQYHTATSSRRGTCRCGSKPLHACGAAARIITARGGGGPYHAPAHGGAAESPPHHPEGRGTGVLPLQTPHHHHHHLDEHVMQGPSLAHLLAHPCLQAKGGGRARAPRAFGRALECHIWHDLHAADHHHGGGGARPHESGKAHHAGQHTTERNTTTTSGKHACLST